MSAGKLNNVFTYGSLMYPEVFGKLVKNTYVSEKALLRDWERRHVKSVVYPGVITCYGKQVMGVVYYGINEEDLIALDRFETQEYEKKDVQVEISNGKRVKSIVYSYVNTSNLESSEWRVEDFENNHMHTFADSHREYKTQILVLQQKEDLEGVQQNQKQ